jgi:hypothetical protein
MANPSPPQPDPVYLGLRRTMFTADPAELGLAPSERLPEVWAALMEIDLGGAVASVVAVADGTTSLYISNGGGVLGTGAYPAVAEAGAFSRFVNGRLPGRGPGLPAGRLVRPGRRATLAWP